MKKIGKIKMMIWIIIALLITGHTIDVKGSGRTPKVIIENYEVIEGSVEPDGRLSVSLQIKNTSRTKSMSNILLTYKNPENIIRSREKGNQVFIDYIGAGKKTTVTIDLEIDKEFSANSILIDFNFDYETEDGEKAVNNAQIALKRDDCILSVGEVSINDNIELGNPTVLSFDYANIGEKDIYNIIMKLEGNIEEEAKIIEIGNISVGQKKTFDYNFFIKKEGMQTLKVSFEYKDSKGTIKKIEEKEYMLNVNVNHNDNQETSPTKHVISGKKIVIFGGGIFLIVVILCIEFMVIKKRKQL